MKNKIIIALLSLTFGMHAMEQEFPQTNKDESSSESKKRKEPNTDKNSDNIWKRKKLDKVMQCFDHGVHTVHQLRNKEGVVTLPTVLKAIMNETFSDLKMESHFLPSDVAKNYEKEIKHALKGTDTNDSIVEKNLREKKKQKLTRNIKITLRNESAREQFTRVVKGLDQVFEGIKNLQHKDGNTAHFFQLIFKEVLAQKELGRSPSEAVIEYAAKALSQTLEGSFQTEQDLPKEGSILYEGLVEYGLLFQKQLNVELHALASSNDSHSTHFTIPTPTEVPILTVAPWIVDSGLENNNLTEQ